MERAQVDAVWSRYARRLHGFLRRRLGSASEADDLLQEVFLRVHVGLCCLEGWPQLERWLFRVARNLLVDHYRARRPTEALGDEEGPAALPDWDDDPAARLAFSLRETVGLLPEPYRGAVAATELDGLTQKAYARREGISLPAAKARVLRGRAKLKALLLACCHFELDARGGIVGYEERCASCEAERGRAPR